MRQEAIKKNDGAWVKIRPALQVYDDSAVLRDTVEDAWQLSDITSDSLRVTSRDTRHSKVIGLDHIHNYMDDPEGQRTLGTSGTLVMNVQLLLYKGELLVEPVAPPATPLKAFVPATPRQTLLTAAAKAAAEDALKKARRAFSWSEEGVKSADNAFSELVQTLKNLEEELREAGHPVEMTVKRSGNVIVLGAAGWWVSFFWERKYSNCLDESRLEITKWDHHPPYPNVIIWEKPQKLATQQYTYGLAALNDPRWLSVTAGDRGYTTLGLAQKVLAELLERPN